MWQLHSSVENIPFISMNWVRRSQEQSDPLNLVKTKRDTTSFVSQKAWKFENWNFARKYKGRKRSPCPAEVMRDRLRKFAVELGTFRGVESSFQRHSSSFHLNWELSEVLKAHFNSKIKNIEDEKEVHARLRWCETDFRNRCSPVPQLLRALKPFNGKEVIREVHYSAENGWKIYLQLANVCHRTERTQLRDLWHDGKH